MILYELYGFILPALSRASAARRCRCSRPCRSCSSPGVLFGYFVVLPAAVRFLVNFNSSEFNVLVQASQFYSFAATMLLAMGLVFQVPVVILGATPPRARHAAPAAQEPALRDRRVRGASPRSCPGDVITLLARDGTAVSALRGEYPGGSVRRASGLAARRDAGRAPARAAGIPRTGPAPTSGQTNGASVQDIIDHVDPRLSD